MVALIGFISKNYHIMTIYVNRTPVVTAVGSIAELHAELGLQQMVAIALNNKVVPRTEWATTPLTEGDNVVIIKMACGG